MDIKKCFIKLRGFFVFDMKSAPSFVNDERFDFDEIVSLQLAFRLYEFSGDNGERYILATATEGTIEPKPEIRGWGLSDFLCKWPSAIRTAPIPSQIQWRTCPQSLVGLVHFFDALRIARYSIFSVASSVQNAERLFVSFLSW